jgi:hypothetical protein
MRVAVIGSRGYAEPGKVELFVYSLPKDWVVVSGGAPGPDSWAVAVARARGMTYIEHLPNDALYPYRVARLERNKLIVADADVMVGFWDGTSTGTLHAAKLAVAARKPLKLVRPQDPTPTPLQLFCLVGYAQGVRYQ